MLVMLVMLLLLVVLVVVLVLVLLVVVPPGRKAALAYPTAAPRLRAGRLRAETPCWK